MHFRRIFLIWFIWRMPLFDRLNDFFDRMDDFFRLFSLFIRLLKSYSNEWESFLEKNEWVYQTTLECRRGGEPKKIQEDFCCLYQKCFLFPTTVSIASPIHKSPIFHVENIREWDWAKHVLNFLMKGVKNKRKGKKQSVDGCVFVLMLIYFHETKFPRPFAPDAPPVPWTQGSSTPSVNAANNTRKLCLNVTRATPDFDLQIVELQQQTCSQPLEVPPLALSLPSSVQEELMKDDFIYVPPQEETQQTSNNE
ncbi:hypothetical protein Ahy_B02g058267 [Arachis hypogaea]|uniref:Uncharacterized protein n=1 Tax=Arachis hypogaea TaxID=3818 RepID=A0A445AE87_ARAHY|nr:hypothetical protein Ahy_B02g058267 [Arachis hypogaea]